MSKFTLLAFVIFVFLLIAIIEEYSISTGSPQVMKRNLYFNELLTKKEQNYPVCGNINALEEELKIEEKNRVNEEKRYDKLLLKGNLNCGNIRVGMGIFSKRHNTPWVDCVPRILPAKRRLLGFIKTLCKDQEEANRKYKQALLEEEEKSRKKLINDKGFTHKNNPSVLNEDGSMSEGGSGGSGSILTPRVKRRGVVYTGKDEHFHDIFQSIYSLRLMNVSLPVEVWVNDRDHKLCVSIFSTVQYPQATSGGVECYKLPNFVQGFTSKYYALLYTTLTDVLFMDADNIAAGDVNTIFDSEEYQSTGSILWPDLWGNRCRAHKGERHPGDSSYENHVFFVGHFGGLKWSNTRAYAQEAEAGQMAFDLTRHSGLLDFGRKFIEDKEFLKLPINGDKDIFRFAHLITGEPFHFVPHFPGYSYSGGHRDCLVHYFNSKSSTAENSSRRNDSLSSTLEKPMFFHQLKTRDPNSFTQFLRVTLRDRSAPSACVILGTIPPDTTNSHSTNIRIEDKRRRKLRHTLDTDRYRQRHLSADISDRIRNSNVSLDVDNSDMSPLIMERYPSDSEKMRNFALKLFTNVDRIWEKGGYNTMIWGHRATLLKSICSLFPRFIRKKIAREGYIY